MMVPEVCNILFFLGPSLLRYTLKHTSQCVPVSHMTPHWTLKHHLKCLQRRLKVYFFFFFYWQICLRQSRAFFLLQKKRKRKGSRGASAWPPDRAQEALIRPPWQNTPSQHVASFQPAEEIQRAACKFPLHSPRLLRLTGRRMVAARSRVQELRPSRTYRWRTCRLGETGLHRLRWTTGGEKRNPVLGVTALTWWGLTEEELRLGYRVEGSMVYWSKFLAMFSGVVCGSNL